MKKFIRWLLLGAALLPFIVEAASISTDTYNNNQKSVPYKPETVKTIGNPPIN